MMVTIKVPDEIYEKFGKHNSANPRAAIEQTLVRFADTGPAGKAITLSSNTLPEVQKLLGGTVDNEEEILALLRKALSFRADGVDVSLNGYQKAIIQKGALANKMPPEKFLERKIQQGLTMVLGA
jgi:hypothetical protein